MTSHWIGPNNGDGVLVDFGLSKREIEDRRIECNRAAEQLAALSELSTIYISEVCDSVGIDAYPLNRAIESLRTESDALILQLEQYL